MHLLLLRALKDRTDPIHPAPFWDSTVPAIERGASDKANGTKHVSIRWSSRHLEGFLSKQNQKGSFLDICKYQKEPPSSPMKQHRSQKKTDNDEAKHSLYCIKLNHIRLRSTTPMIPNYVPWSLWEAVLTIKWPLLARVRRRRKGPSAAWCMSFFGGLQMASSFKVVS